MITRAPATTQKELHRMSRSLYNHGLCTVLALCTISSAATAQYSGSRRANYPDNIGITGPPPIPPSVAALVIEHSLELGLADSQLVAIESIRRMQDSANRPWMLRLDSLRPTRMPAGGQNDLSPEQREEITARKAAIVATMEGMRETNADARIRTMALLTPAQQRRAAEFEDDARKKAEDDGKRRARNGFGGDGGDGRTGGRSGRPPTG